MHLVKKKSKVHLQRKCNKEQSYPLLLQIFDTRQWENEVSATHQRQVFHGEDKRTINDDDDFKQTHTQILKRRITCLHINTREEDEEDK